MNMRCLNCHCERTPLNLEICPNCGVYLPALLKDLLSPQTVLQENYRIKEVLGQGSFGITYHAEHCILNRSVAIKEFFPQDYATRNPLTHEVQVPLGQEPSYQRGLQHFVEEGRMLVHLNHPNVIQIRDLFEEKNTAYLVMDLVDGKTLTSILAVQPGRKLPPEQVENLMGQLVSALATIHATGVYHLDIKPDNLLLTPEHKLVLIDFGAAKQATSRSLHQTRFFTESYAAPELMSGGEVSPESDIFELGMLLYELLTGSLPTPAITRLVEGDTWTPVFLEEPWRTRVLAALQLKRDDRPNNVEQWWGNYHRTSVSLLEADRKDKMVASLRGSFLLEDLKKQGMQRRFGRGEIVNVFPLDRHLLMVCAAGGATLFDLQCQDVLWEIDCPTDCATLSLNKAYLAIAWGQDIYIWSALTGSLVQKLTGHEKPITDLAFDPTRQTIVSASEDGTIRFWDIASSTLIRQLTDSQGLLTSIAISADGRWLASGSRNQTIDLWDLASGQTIHRLAGHRLGVNRVVFSPDSRWLISGSRDHTVKVWEVASGILLRHLKGHTGWVTDLAVSSDGHLLASASGIDDKSILIWDLGTGECLGQLQGHWNSVRAIAFCPDSYLLVSASYDYTVRIWDIPSTQTIDTLRQHTNWVYSVAASPDGRWVASGNNDRTIHLWNALNQRLVKQFVGHGDLVTNVVFSPDGKMIASSSWDRTVRLWNVDQGQPLKVLHGHQGFVYSVAISPNGQWLASGSSDRTIRLWEVSRDKWFPIRSKTVRIVTGHLDDVRTVAFSADSRLIISGSDDRTIRVWEVASGQEIYRLDHPNSRIDCIAVHPAGTGLASGGYDPTIALWDMTKGRAIAQLVGHKGKINSLAFSPDGQYLISGSADRTVKLWNVSSGQLLRSWTGHTTTVNSVNFCQDGTFVISGDNHGVIRLWRV